MSERPIAAIILAAGKGTRMKSSRHKVLHEVAGRPMIEHLLASVETLGPQKLVTIVGESREQLEERLEGRVDFAVQEPQLGTGHAVQQAQEALEGFEGDVLVLYGDVPFVKAGTMQAMIDRLRAVDSPAAVVLGFEPDDPLRYGRVIAQQGRILKMVEYKDATEDERGCTLCNSGLLAARSEDLFALLDRVRNENAQGEYYLPDIVNIAIADGHNCAVVSCDNADEVAGINSRAELAARARKAALAPSSGHLVLRGLSGNEADVRFQTRPLPGGGSVALFADDHGPALEARLREAERAREEAEEEARAKSQFLASVSHELRTPLNAIIGFSDVMKARLFGPMPARYAEYADLIHESGQHLMELIGDVLDMSKIEAERYELVRERFDIDEIVGLVAKMMRLQAEEAGITLSVKRNDVAVPVMGDRKALRQILLNLLSNAVKFTPEGGAIVVMARPSGGQLVLAVGDSGVGIDPEDAGLAPVRAERHRHAFGGGCRFVEQRAIRDVHAGQFKHHRLEIQDGFEPTLRDFRLVGRIGGIPGRVFQHVAQDHRRGVAIIISHADH